MRRIGIKGVTIQVHPKLYDKMEELRKQFAQNNISLSQMELTNMIATKIRIPQVNIMGIKNERKKR